MNWLDYVAGVNEHLGLEAKRRGTEDMRKRAIRNAVIDLQRFIKAYRSGHTSTFTDADVTLDGFASRGVLPTGARSTGFYTISSDYDPTLNCKRNTMTWVDWNSRQSLICGKATCGTYVYTISPMGKDFIVYPAINSKTSLLLVYELLKSDFADVDVVPFPEESQEAVAAYVKWRLFVEVDKNPGLAKDQYGFYVLRRMSLLRDEQEKIEADNQAEEYV